MKTPLEFMYNELTRNLRSLHWHTAVLEACDWDEDKKRELLDEVGSLLEDLLKQAQGSELESPFILVALREKLRAIAQEDQIDNLMNLLQAETALAAGDTEVSNGHVGLLQGQAEA